MTRNNHTTADNRPSEPRADTHSDIASTGQSTANQDDVVTLAHGAGGEAMRSLVDTLAVSRFADGSSADTAGAVGLAALDDGSVHPLPGTDISIVLTTDSHIVTPPTFPGGDIGRLSVAGTVNDLAVMGVTDPLALTCGLVVEEGTPTAELDRFLESMRESAVEAGVDITTGDTKVMGAGELDGIVLNTTGVGTIPTSEVVTGAGLSPGDAIVLSGTVGDHGIALLAEREGFDFGANLESDVAPINGLVAAATDAGRVTAMTDPTRGGLATALNEMAEKAGVGLEIEEQAIPVDDAIASAGEVLGIDPLSVANEGKVVFGVHSDDADSVLAALREQPLGSNAAIIGQVISDHPGRVVLDTGFGNRYLSEPTGEALPRIC
ncbi:hydrogenase expression/formation protein HypE [Natrarchaeobaculum sulfurireducens]|uniref:Hydrogenase expression/formation protein HypE n=1 Tax=Natrarchaeobaculum sulfurireducens TaxID=2044521 RepID=A0A346P9X4_9EURY|nr:hydrogenase expression/formation protein HypE [Natrarchaeobaculum sulfurireducens]AXR76319.1 hydrogenase expression/formation protein HypE [Natrarchaeobaculum sulfurireducens]AXR80004.1 Hydrogenase maturation factor HypE [Natrarchaeobaculum sulfurireducens]